MLDANILPIFEAILGLYIKSIKYKNPPDNTLEGSSICLHKSNKNSSFSVFEVFGMYFTPPAAPEIVITCPSSNFSNTFLTTIRSSLIVDFAELNFSVK